MAINTITSIGTSIGTIAMSVIAAYNVYLTRIDVQHKRKMQSLINLLYSLFYNEKTSILVELRRRVRILHAFIVIFCLKDSGESNAYEFSRYSYLDDDGDTTAKRYVDFSTILLFKCGTDEEIFERYKKFCKIIKDFFIGEATREKQGSFYYKGKTTKSSYKHFLNHMFSGDCNRIAFEYLLGVEKAENFIKNHGVDIGIFNLFVNSMNEKDKRQQLKVFSYAWYDKGFYFPSYEYLKKLLKDVDTFNFDFALERIREHCNGFVEYLAEWIGFDYSTEKSPIQRYSEICEILNSLSNINDGILQRLYDIFSAIKVYYIPDVFFLRRGQLLKQMKKILKYNELSCNEMEASFKISEGWGKYQTINISYKVKNSSNYWKNETK